MSFKGIKQDERAELAREFLAELLDEQLLASTVWRVMFCWQLTRLHLAETILNAEKLKRGLISLTDLTPEERRRLVDPTSLDLKAIANGPIMDPANIYLPAGKLSMAETREREARQELAA